MKHPGKANLSCWVSALLLDYVYFAKKGLRTVHDTVCCVLPAPCVCDQEASRVSQPLVLDYIYASAEKGLRIVHGTLYCVLIAPCVCDQEASRVSQPLLLDYIYASAEKGLRIVHGTVCHILIMPCICGQGEPTSCAGLCILWQRKG